MKCRLGSLVAFAVLGYVGWGSSARAGEAGNVLSAKEKAAGWQLLFDGKSIAGWRGFRTDTFPEKGWKVVDGVLVHEKSVKAGDIVTTEAFDNFELRLEFRLTPRANSGIKYLVDENLVK